MLTHSDTGGRPRWHVVGIRDGSRYVLESYRVRRVAEDRAELFRGVLERYARIVVEGETDALLAPVADDAPDPFAARVQCRHCGRVRLCRNRKFGRWILPSHALPRLGQPQRYCPGSLKPGLAVGSGAAVSAPGS
jgi:hypothetical protein